MRLLLRCDGGPGIGVGHVVRSLAVAEEALARGHEVSLLGDLEGELLEGLTAGLPDLSLLGPADGDGLHPDLVAGFDVVHVDHYGLGREVLETFVLHTRPGGPRPLLSVVADGPFGAQPADVLVDPTVGAERSHPPAPARWHLRGGRFAPIRRAVTEAAARGTVSDGPPRVLVVMGGTDPLGCAPAVVEGLGRVGVPLDVTVVTAAATGEALRGAASRWTHGSLRPVAPSGDLPTVMAASDLVVTAAGTSVWELCTLSRAIAVVAVVDNQQIGYDEVVGAGAAVGLGTPADLVDPESVADALRPALGDPSLRSRLGDAAHRLVDGRGAWRLVGMLESAVRAPVPSADGPTVEVRPATLGDAALLLEWRNDPGTRAASRHHGEVAPEDHLAWLSASLGRPDRHLLVGSLDGVPVGTVRWDDEGAGEWEVSITVAAAARGRRTSGPLLRAGQTWLSRRERPTAYLAVVHEDNHASQRLFLAEGYAPDLPPDPDGFERFVRTLR